MRCDDQVNIQLRGRNWKGCGQALGQNISHGLWKKKNINFIQGSSKLDDVNLEYKSD
jgi:hypothetical protein